MRHSFLTIAAVFACAGRIVSLAQEPVRKPLPLTLHSDLLSEDRRILVRLPRHYEADSAAHYPVLYKFDGDNQLDRYDEAIDVLQSTDAMPDLIVGASERPRNAQSRSDPGQPAPGRQ